MSKRKFKKARLVARDPGGRTTVKQKLLLIGFGFLLSFLLLFILEAGLNLLGVAAPNRYDDPFVGFEPGHDLFEKQTDEKSAPIYVTAKPKLRFFNLQQFSDPKPPNTYRVFALGGSTTYGRPYDHRISFSKWMQLLLDEMDSTRNYEVINAGGVSYASYRIVVLMKELVRYQPDLFVVYTGHNEFLEERSYRDIIHESPLLRYVKKQLNGLGTVGLLKSGVAKLKNEAESQGGELQSEVKAKLDVWSGLESFTRNDSLKQAILKHYRFNIQQVVDIARDHDIDMLFINPASNIKDFSPFKSEHLPSLTPETIDRFEALYQEGKALLEQDEYTEALARLEQAAKLSPEYADVYYRMGRCYLGLGDFEKAEEHLTRALELDICPLRALKEINASVIDTAFQNGVPIIDLPAFLRQDSLARYGHGILGNAYFLDHVHPRIEIHQRLAEWIIDALAEKGLVRIEKQLGPGRKQALYDGFLKDLDPSFYAHRDLNLGKVLGWAGKNEEAAEAFRRASRTMADDPMVHYNLGVVYQKQGKTELAIEEYQNVVRLQPQFAEAHFNLGKCYLSLGAYERAAASFQRMLELKPSDAKAHYNLALCYRELKRFGQEVVELEKAWAADPEFPGIARLMGSVYQRESKLDEALRAYRQNLERHPDDPGAHNDVSVVYRLKGRLDEARRASSKALELDPTFVDAHRNLALIYESRGEVEAADRAFQKVAELLPSDFQAHFDLGTFYQKQGRWDDAITAYRKAVALSPALARGYSFLGAALGKKGMVDEAIAAFRKAIELNPNAGGAHYHLASLYYSRRQPELAAQHFQRAQEIGIKVPARIVEELRPYMR